LVGEGCRTSVWGEEVTPEGSGLRGDDAEAFTARPATFAPWSGSMRDLGMEGMRAAQLAIAETPHGTS
jgi:hypothetical protein